MSKMTRAIRLSMPDPLADLKSLADKVLAAAAPASSQSLHFNFTVLEGDLFGLECQYDPSEPWPVDFVALELALWRATLTFQQLGLTFWRVSWTMRRAFAGVLEGLRAERFCDQHSNGTHGNCGRCATARRRAEVRAS